ncbi:MAG: acyl-CoA dehydrogenase family protein [bacterium]|nr:acyl-CoA dehydrogenase family protein [bacterium]
MNYCISEREEHVKATAQKIAKEKIIPQRELLDEKKEFPYEIVKELTNTGMFRLFIPKAYGGDGGGDTELCIIVEEIGKACAAVATTYAASALAATPIILFGSENQKMKYLSKIAKGSLASFCLTEPSAGSDAGGIQTRAIKENDSYIINGAKQWITNGGEAEVYVVFAATNPSRGARGLSAFIVEKGTPGISFGKIEDKLGIRASCTREVIFENCKVPAENLIGKEGVGFIVAMRTFDHTRPGVGALAVGIAQGALDELIAYAKQIKAPLSLFEQIAELYTKVEAARALVYSTARYLDSGAKDVSMYSSMSKLFPSEVAMEVTSKVIELFGIFGCRRKYAVEKIMRDAKITQIYEGTNEIQKLIIANAIAK